MERRSVQAVLLCAGKGTRLASHSRSLPKVLVEVNGKSLLRHKLEMLDGLVDEVIIIVGHKAEKIINDIGYKFRKLKISYCRQDKLLGTGHALQQVEDMIDDEFVVMNGDDLYDMDDVKRMIEMRGYGILGKKVVDPSSFGVIVSEDGVFEKIVEKPKRFISQIANIGCYRLDRKVFQIDIKKSERGEFEIVDMINGLVEMRYDIKVVEAKGDWFPVNDARQLKEAEKGLEIRG